MKQVIIVGAGRSGTKFLRGLLASGENVRAVPYDVNYIWREGNEYSPDDELMPNSVTPQIQKRIQSSLYALAGISSVNSNTILIEKSVPNSLRVPFVDAVFPDALYIHLIRDGRQVVESAFRNWKQGPEAGYLLRKIRSFPLRNWRYAIWYAFNMAKRLMGGKAGKSRSTWGPRYRGIDSDISELPLIQVVARQWCRCVNQSHEALSHIPAERRIEIRYEDLISNEKYITEVASFIGVTGIEKVVMNFKKSLRPPTVDGWCDRLSEDERELAMLEIGETLKALGYD